jgi:hypothetical protein
LTVPIHRLCAALAITLLLLGPARAQDCPIPGQHRMMVFRLFFGRGPAAHPSVTERQWRQFLAAEVTPRFPAGLTVIDADGQWQDPASHVIERERSKLLLIATPDTPAVRDNIVALAAAYRQQFKQQSVGIVAEPACAAFD